MDRRFLLVAAVLVLLIAGFSGVGAADRTLRNTTDNVTQTETLTGISVGQYATVEQSHLNDLEELAETTPYEVRDYTFTLFVDGERYIVFTDQEPQTGTATVEGTVIEDPPNHYNSYILADNVSFETEGEPVPLSNVQADPSQYDGQHIRVTGSYQQLSATYETQNQIIVHQNHGRISAERQSLDLAQSPAQSARWSVLNLSNDEFGGSADAELEQRFAEMNSAMPVLGLHSEFWMRGEVTVDAIVAAGSDESRLIIADTTPVADEISGPNEINQRGEHLSGEVVRFETQVVGSTTSTQEFLTTVAPCGGGDSVLVPAGPTCVPVVSDSTVHAGVLLSGPPDSRSDVVPYAGISNYHQDTVTESETGTYIVTGRVVAASEIDPSLEGQYGVVVYGMDRQGDLQTHGDVEAQAEEYATQVTDRLKAQLNTSQQEWRTMSGSGNGGDQAGGVSGSSSIAIINTEYEQNPIQPGTTAVAVITVENTGTADGMITLSWRFVSDTVEETIVSVAAGETKEVRLEHQVTDRFSGSSVRTHVNSNDLGMLEIDAQTATASTTSVSDRIDADDGSNGTLMAGISGASFEIGGLVILLGTTLLLSGIVLKLFYGVKKILQPDDVDITEPPAFIMSVVGVALMAAGGFIAGSIFEAVVPLSVFLLGGLTVVKLGGMVYSEI
ncbi:hypothetical protein [Halostella sp. PRR32]|uniref:hypothetical protein n=1 Tax=Halostella sp. PRR32 TaxID=3098147 RepID=UPI002B1D734F|nr:hypothetical protein [Halostella sp. PRR32]